jgi:hypothetical protein
VVSSTAHERPEITAGIATTGGEVLMPWVNDDGGRADAGFTGHTRDCVVRAIAIATGRSYLNVYSSLHRYALIDRALMAKLTLRYGARAQAHASPRTGVNRRVYDRYLRECGWTWTATMRVGAGCTVHLRADELRSWRHRVFVRRRGWAS